MIPNAQHFQGLSAAQPLVTIGYGRAEITPPLGTLCALGVDDEALEIIDPVYVRATVLGEGRSAVAILSLDVIGLYRPEIDDLRGLIAANTGLAPERIILHTTHSHESPNTERSFGALVAPYGLNWCTPEFYESLRGQALKAVKTALADMHPATVSTALWPVAEVASNRRLKPLDGPTVLRQSRSTAEYRQYPEGWIDPYVRMLVFSDPANGREHWLLNYACHPTAAGGDEAPYITGDFPGNAMARIEASRPRVTCNYLTGACGNINPGKYTESGVTPAERAADVVRLGGRLAEAVLASRERGLSPAAADAPRWARRPVALPLLPRVADAGPLKEALAAEAQAYQVRRAAGQRVRGGGATLFWTVYNLFAASSAQPDGTLASEVCAIGLGEVGLLFLPGECFLEIADAVRRHFPGRPLLIAELCDAGPGYIVTPDAFAGGGYESEAALCAPEALQMLIDAGIAALEEVLPAREKA
ncbi:MAG TPA: hypothetical protein VGA61_00375 [Anaerolineae bacterium]